MRFEETEIIKSSREYAEDVLLQLPEYFYYHNLLHTKEVTAAAIDIGSNSGLDYEEMEMVVLAAWYHDLGYSCSCDDHEEESIIMMEGKLRELNVPYEKIANIAEIIRATKIPQTPQSLCAKVLCDADLYHLSSEDYELKSEALRKELNAIKKHDISVAEWRKMNIEFLTKHNYFTPYAQARLKEPKKANLAKLRKGSIVNKEVTNLEKEIIKLKTKLEKAKSQTPDRGIQTMFNTTSENHITLSGMADNKANIMISINSIVLSVLVSVLFRKFEEYPHLIIPGIILSFVCLTTIVFSVLATLPTITSGTFSKEDIYKRRTNLLFFGNFHKMKLENYMWGMKELIKDADFLYGSMIKDIYYLGKVLGKKYRLLRISYTIFMFGFVISILAFIIAMLFFSPAREAL